MIFPSCQSPFLYCLCLGACAGSTGGGLKVSRIAIMLKNIKVEIEKDHSPKDGYECAYGLKTCGKVGYKFYPRLSFRLHCGVYIFHVDYLFG